MAVLSRRETLRRCANGFGGLALSALMAEWSGGEARADAVPGRTLDPMAVRPPQYKAKATSVIFLFMDGGVSHVDSFDRKERLQKESGKELPLKRPQHVRAVSPVLFGSPFEFHRYGRSGAEVSDLFPNIATCVDDLAIIRSMVAEHSEHTAGNYFMHSGSGLQGRPSMGAWVTYGLGSVGRNLPGFVVMDTGMIPPGGVDIFGSGFLPASYQGSLFRRGKFPVADIAPRETESALQAGKLDLLRNLDRRVAERYGPVDEMDAAIANYELAFRMQTSVPELGEISGETEATRKLYGLDEKDTEDFGRACLLARRMVERGVRFIELLPPKREGADRWDQHSRLKQGHMANAKATDKPIAGTVEGSESAWPPGPDVDHLGRRIRPHAHSTRIRRHDWPRPSSVWIQHVAGGRRRKGRRDLRRNR